MVVACITTIGLLVVQRFQRHEDTRSNARGHRMPQANPRRTLQSPNRVMLCQVLNICLRRANQLDNRVELEMDGETWLAQYART